MWQGGRCLALGRGQGEMPRAGANREPSGSGDFSASEKDCGSNTQRRLPRLNPMPPRSQPIRRAGSYRFAWSAARFPDE